MLNPFRKPFSVAGEPDRLQPIIVLYSPDEFDKVHEYLMALAADPLVEIHGSGFIMLPEEVFEQASCIANVSKGYGWYGQ